MRPSSIRPVRLALMLLLVVLALALAPPRPAQAGPIPGSKWSSIGPEPDCCFFPPYGETGRATSIAVNPQNPDDVWIGTAGGGVWHLSGGKWFPMSDDQASLAIGSLALTGCNSTGCAKIYAGTGENAIRRDTYYGAGLLEGDISGNSVAWTLHKGQAGPPAYDFTHGTIYNVVLDPTTGGASQVIYITVSSGVTASASESTVTAPPPLGGWGIYKSSDDGNTWTKLLIPGASTGLGAGRPTDLEMDRTNAGTLYAGFLGRGIFKSLDGGTNWCPLNPGIAKPNGCPMTYGLPGLPSQFDHVEIDIYRGDHNHLYASFGNCPDRLVADCEPSIYESTNAGLNWSTRYIGSTSATSFGDLTCPRAYTRYMHGLTISPTNPATIYVAGFHICESDDHGGTWSATDDNTGGGMLHPDHHAIVFHATTTSRVYDVNDGGVAFSTDGGGKWTPSTNGLDTFEFQSLATSPSTLQVFGGTQDNAAVAWNGVKNWQHLACCGDGGYTAYETFNFGGFFDKTYMYTTTNMNGLGNLAVLPVKSENGGGSWPQPGDPPVSYDLGLNDAESRSFYPPLVVAGGYAMFATDRLYTSVDQMHDWQLRSPQLSSDPESEIFSLADAITAIAVAPSNPSRWYLGYYSGKIFYTNGACSNLSCWTQVSNPSGNAPITWLAVDPTSADNVYATVSGFAPGIHVFKTANAGVTWSPAGSHPDLSGVPANTITIDPGAPKVLYLGTDHGIYRSDSYGDSWNRFSDGLPNVPVYAITPDASRDLLFAATHGRGAYLLTSNKGIGRMLVDGPIRVGPEIRYNLPVFGSHLAENASCLVKVLAADGSVCASGRTDALGGTIHTDAEGTLATSQANKYVDLPMVWACAQGSCLDTEMRKCVRGTAGPSGVEVDCGGGVTVSKAPGPAGEPNPGSSRFTLGERQPGPNGFGGMFSLLPAVQTGDGASQIFCAPMVPFAPGDTQGAILQRAADMVNGDGSCRAAGVQAVVEAPQDGGEVEDAFAHSGHLSLAAPNLTGGKLIPGLKVMPGQAMGTCFTAGDLLDLMRGRSRSMKIQFATGPGGASGGPIRILEQSLLGQCDITVPTPAGAGAAGIAAAVAAAFQSGGIPSPYPLCSVDSNPRDLFAAGDSVHTALATDLTICLNDPGVGVTVLPSEICTTNADCDDGNPCTTDTCMPATGLCQSTPAPNGTPCDDHNACTVGGTCQSGTCGQPVSCNDGNPCSTDICNPATGACTSTPIVCDDGNPCTTDTCSAATGGCVFTPAPAGSTCNDGDPCTTGDTCVSIPGSTTPICQGAPKCADADPCTADTCDPATGACVNTPIVCDDANPCTADACVNGACISTPIPAGSVCDDGSLCTTGGTCQPDPFTGAATCSSAPVNCDDGDACTMDTCEPTTGGCRHIPISFAEVPTGLQFTSANSFNWPGVSGASFYNTYRGTIPQHMMASRPPAGPLYDQGCFEYGDAHGDGAMIATDTSVPAVGTGFYYLVSEETGCGESSIGSDWNGTPIPNANPCSNPAPPQLQIVKSHSGNFTQGQTGANYFLVVSNIGPGPTFGMVTVTELRPPPLTLVSMAGPGWNCPASPGNTCNRSDTLAPGAAYPPVTVTVNVASNSYTPVLNEADVSGGGAPDAMSTDSTTVIQLAPALSITKTHTGHFYLGQPDASYMVRVSNTGNAPTSGTVNVTDAPPAGMSVTSMSGTGWTCNAAGCSRSDALAAASSYPVITVAVSLTSFTSASEVNQATVSGGGSPSATANDTTMIDYPLLALLKNHTGNFYQGQTNAIYTLKVQDQGFGPTLGTVTVTELTPAGLTLVSMAGTGWSCPASPGNVCTRSDVLASTAFYPDITVTVNVASNAPSSIFNHATISGGGSIGVGNAFDPTTIDPAAPVLAITKTHTGNFTQGQQGAPYTVTVSNTGNAPTSGTITVTETVPSGLVLVSMAGTGWTCPSPGNTCSRSDVLAAGASYPVITVTVNVLATASSPQVNQVSASQPGLPPATTSDSTNIDPGMPILSVTKTHNGNFSQGQTNATYKVTVTNTGPVPTIGPVNVDDLLPPGLTFVSMSGTGWTCGGPPHCNRTDSLAPGASYPVLTVTVNVLPTAPSPQVNQVNVGGGGAGPAMASDSTTIVPAGVPNLSITKTHTGNFTQGQTNATYNLVVSNAIGAGATAGVVTVTDTLPSGLVPVGMSGLGWSCAFPTCTRPASLSPGTNSTPILVTVNVLPTATSPQINQASVSGGGSAPASTTDPTVILVP
jgi:uncharacterized repeat protein (TIGR01451 family)